MDFSQKELQDMKRFYEQERGRLLGQLAHVEEMLVKLTGQPLASRRVAATTTLTGSKQRKRGPKSVWGNFIVKRLRARNRPMTYKELIDDAMAIHRLGPDREASARASILNSAFRLRTVHGRVETIGRAGKKEKFLVLTKWLDQDGMLTSPFDEEFRKIAGGRHVAVDMAAIPTPRYDEYDVEMDGEEGEVVEITEASAEA